jgi:hypothetical protein
VKKNNQESRRPRPAVCSSAREIHFFLLRALDGIRDRCATLARHSAERAALAVQLAAFDDSTERNRKRALTAIRTSMFHCDTLCAQKILDRSAHDHLRRRVDQLIAGLKALEGMPADRWLDLPMPALEAEQTEGNEAASPTLFQIIVDRVAQAVRTVLPRPSPLETGPTLQGQPSSGDKGSGESSE